MILYGPMFGTEAALVRHNLVSGTHTLAVGLFGLLRPGDIMLSVTGRPYDTLDEVIGGRRGEGSLADFGIEYKQIELAGGRIDYAALDCAIGRLGGRIKVVYVQRSRGYSDRRTLFADEISELTDYIHKKLPGAYVMVDNCYGEFTEEHEPRADMLVGSLIKNPGGGMAESGGYIAGSARAVELASYRLTTVGTGARSGLARPDKKYAQGAVLCPAYHGAGAENRAFCRLYIQQPRVQGCPRLGRGPFGHNTDG